jgi:hypothetical protein
MSSLAPLGVLQLRSRDVAFLRERFLPGGKSLECIQPTLDPRVGSERRIYEGAGFTLAEEEHHRDFGHDLIGQVWVRNL